MMKVVNVLAVVFLCLGGVSAQAGVLSHWGFEETSGATAADDAGGITATTGGGTFDLGVPGVFGSGVQMTDGFMDMAAIPAFHTSSFSFAAWVKIPDISLRCPILGEWSGSAGTPAGYSFLFEQPGGGNAGKIQMSFQNTDKIHIPYPRDNAPDGQPADGDSWSFSSAEPVFADGDWHHVAFSFDRPTKTGRIFTDGILVDEVTTNRTNVDVFVNTITPKIGRKEDGGTNFTGYMDEVYIFDHALGIGEVNALIPEPTSLLMLGLGGLAIYHRKRAKS